MARLWIMGASAIALMASGCFGGPTAAPSATTHGPAAGVHARAYGSFRIRGTYARGGSTNQFGGDLHRMRFTLTCPRPGGYGAITGTMSWRQSLCRAILDHRT
jgi:hypothetical protein